MKTYFASDIDGAVYKPGNIFWTKHRKIFYPPMIAGQGHLTPYLKKKFTSMKRDEVIVSW